MKKTGILNRDISAIIAETGHFDRIVVCDAGFPIPRGVRCIDLSVGPNLPTVFEILKMIVQELPVEQFWVAEEVTPSASDRILELSDIFPDAEAIQVPHDQFKMLARDAVGVIRTGDFRPYSNVMIASGVAY